MYTYGIPMPAAKQPAKSTAKQPAKSAAKQPAKSAAKQPAKSAANRESALLNQVLRETNLRALIKRTMIKDKIKNENRVKAFQNAKNTAYQRMKYAGRENFRKHTGSIFVAHFQMGEKNRIIDFYGPYKFKKTGSYWSNNNKFVSPWKSLNTNKSGLLVFNKKKNNWVQMKNNKITNDYVM